MMWSVGLPPRYKHRRLAVRDEDKTVPFVIIRHRHLRTVDYNKAFDWGPEFFQIKQYYLDLTCSDIHDASAEIEDTVRTIRHHIGEIYAVAGPDAIYIPQELKWYLGDLQYPVPSKTLQYLADPEYYIDEYPVILGERNIYAFLAYTVNRIAYFVACHCDEMVEVCQQRLKSCFVSLNWDTVLCMPAQLRKEVMEIVSHMWSEKKEEALKKLNDDNSSEETILCLSDTELETLEQEFMQPDEMDRQSEKCKKEFLNQLDEGSKERSRQDEGQDEHLKKLEEETDRVMQKKHAKEKPGDEVDRRREKCKKEFLNQLDEGSKKSRQDEGQDEFLKKLEEETDRVMQKKHAKEKPEDEVDRQSEKCKKEFLNQLDEGSKKRSRQDEGQDEDLKKLEEETDRVMQKKHAKEKPETQKEQQLKEVVEEEDKEASEKKQGMGKCQTHKFKLVGDTYTQDALDNLEEDEEDESDYSDDPYSHDSNAAENPLDDYPDEESSEDKGDDDREEPLDYEDDDDDDDDQPD